MKEKKLIKISIIFFCIIIVILIILALMLFKSIYNSDIDSSLDKGYCWDYIRNRCEEKDQGFCVKSEQDCKDRHGKWLEHKKYCSFQ